MNVVRSTGGGGGGCGNYKLELETATVPHPISRPTSTIAELMRLTNFSKDEICHLYRTFKQDSPSGQVNKERFVAILASLFPNGECFRYASFLFQNVDRANTGSIRFEDLVLTLSILIHGSVEDRLCWIFDLYDLNKDGVLTKMELLQLVTSVFQLIVPISKLNFTTITSAVEERTDQLFRNWDANGNGVVHKEEFLKYCLKDETILRSLDVLNSDIFRRR